MSEIDWSKAPEGTTHYCPKLPGLNAAWCKRDENGQWLFSNCILNTAWLPDYFQDDESRYVPRYPEPQTAPTLETMLTEWRDLEARAQAAQAEADALFEHAGQCHGEIVVRLAELGWGAPRKPTVTLDDNDGWIEWNGGECPVPNDVWVEVKLRGCSSSFDTGKGGEWGWRVNPKNPNGGDIVAYRLTPSAQQ